MLFRSESLCEQALRELEDVSMYYKPRKSTGTHYAGVNFAIGTRILYFPCVLDAEKKALHCMWCEWALNLEHPQCADWTSKEHCYTN